MPSPSLLQRLKERKLVQWALAYLAGAFVVFQAVEVLAEPWRISPALQRAIHILLLAGFLITLVLAWYHGEKGRQRVSGPELLMVAALLVIAGGVLTILPGGERVPETTETAVSPVVDDTRPSIAVLMCDNFSPDPDDAFRAQGIHEEILLQLQGISSVRSVGRRSVLQFAETPLPVDEIATALRVGFVGECSVLKDPDQTQIRITFQLLDARGVQLWAERYDRDLTVANIFDIQADIAQRVANRVGAVLTPDDEARIASMPTESSEAFDAFQRGRFYLRKEVREGDFRTAIQFFRRALEIDPMLAPAYSGLGEAYAWLGMGNIDAPEETWPNASEASNRALEIDESLPTAHAVLALEKMHYQHDWEGAEAGFRRSLDLDPDQADTRLYYSKLLAVLHRDEEALAQASAAKALDPHSPWVDMMRCWIFQFTRRFDEAHEIAEGMIESEPPNPLGDLLLAQTYTQQGRYEAALAPLRAWTISQGEDVSDELGWLGMLNGLLGKEEDARQYKDQLEGLVEQGRWVSPVTRAWAAIGLGDLDRALDFLEEGREKRDFWMIHVVGLEYMTPGVGDHPKFRDLKRRMGLE